MIYGAEHKELIRSLTRFIDQEINPYVDEWEAAGEFPTHDLFKKLGAAGFLGVSKPEAFGGLGLDYSYSLAVAETLGQIHCGGVPMAIGVQTDMATPALARFGSDYVRETYLRPAISGEFVACIGVSEPGAGSDVANIKSHARKDGDDYVINGQKMWITNGTKADFMTMLVNTGDGPMHQSKSLIIVPMESPGITVARKLDKMGMRSSDTAQLYFEDVRVPARNLIGEEGKGFTYQMLQFQEERLWAAGAGLKPLEKAIADVIDYTRTREAFGKPLLDNQYIHFRLAELMTEVEELRSLTYRAVYDYVRDKDVTMLASMAKLKVGRLSREVADACLQYYGGMGFMNETPITRFYRDSRLTSIGGGADEVMLGIICKYMDILPKERRG
ncbi:acyl-CoA dehydrogenase family protein [Sneathiella sp.]|uniref:acyl-CoA dehydrogenase family protein n=1 Tax=Sneathiella sp. TaxID=1964365 RepID=UPI002FE2D1E1